MSLPPHSRLVLVVLLAIASFGAASCAEHFGPSYYIESQQIRVDFDASANPAIHVDAEYKLRNDGARPLSSMILRLPGRRQFHLTTSQASWDGASLPEPALEGNPRDTFLTLPRSWKMRESHTLRLLATFQSPGPGETGFRFAPDAFFLPSEGWAPQLLPAEGLFGSGGVPPQKWTLSVTAPQGFLIHTSGRNVKSSPHGAKVTVTSVQTTADRYPFVVSGRYQESRLDAGSQKISLWTRSIADAASLHQSADALIRAFQTYDATFGSRSSNSQALWIVECPAPQGCSVVSESMYASLLGVEPGSATSSLASLDTLMLDFTGGVPKLATAAPGLAASWLGYGQNPGFYDRQLPVAALPAFASALGQEAVAGSSVRGETIRWALRVIPKTAHAGKHEAEDPTVLRAKSLLFFYGLEDHFGREIFRRAINHMLAARRERDFDLDDLIASFDQESHQNTAEFVRQWMKHPGVPEDFRARYEVASASTAANSKENMP